MATGFKNYIRKLDEHLFSKHLKDNRFMRPDDGTDMFGNSYDDEQEATNDNKKLVVIQSQKSTQSASIRATEKKFIQDWNTSFEANQKEYDTFKKAHDSGIFQQLTEAARAGIDFDIISMDDINQTLSKFALLPETIKIEITKVVEAKTGIKLEHISKLSKPKMLWELNDEWGESEVLNWLKFKNLINGLETYKLVSQLSNFSNLSLSLVSKSDEEVTELSREISEFYIINEHMIKHLKQGEYHLFGYDITPPQNVLKAQCEKYWKRRIRREIADIETWVSNMLGLAGADRLFISNHTLNRFSDMWKRNKKYLEETYIMNSKKEYVCLADIAKTKSKARLSMMYSIIQGMTDEAKDRNLTPVFITVTLPPEYHPMKNKGYTRNEQFGGFSGTQQRQEMQTRWKHVRAMVAKNDINVFGMLVNESHKDGTPHRHMLCFLPQNEIPDLNHCFQTHFPETESNKWRLPENGVSYNIKVLDSHSGATAYVSKYLRKTVNLDSQEASTETHVDEDQLNNFDEYKAWASSRRIRRYDFFGLKSIITKWARIYKEKERPQGFFGEIWDDMKSHRFKSALQKLGAFGDYKNFIIKIKYTEHLNMYEETYRKPQTLECHNSDTGEKWELSMESQWFVLDKDSIDSFINMDSKQQNDFIVTLISNYPRSGFAEGDLDPIPIDPPKKLTETERAERKKITLERDKAAYKNKAA
ncbi:replication endonuclease [Thalassospira sp. ER-Se-21-Dark]|uniref:replication endonuclease n=1 Tax=Thalassospira sp. ER-Se-21-Dark TaxID=2585190 RepID=UPI001B301473|nr:replication endonuclease [Thalassospira sp. ER-Se-21-Dark]MBP3127967.1 replication endonuclease [Thalassospira sp. ER-Se-21-Dark]